MTLIADYDTRQLHIEDITPQTCLINVTGAHTQGRIYIGKKDAETAIAVLQEFIDMQDG